MIDLIGHLTGLVARGRAAPLLVTFSRKPVPGLMAQVFGPGSACNLVLGAGAGARRFEQALVQTDPATPPTEAALAALEQRVFGPGGGAPTIARFVDRGTLKWMLRERAEFLRGCAGVVVQIGEAEALAEALALLAAAGHSAAESFPLERGGAIVVASPAPVPGEGDVRPALLERLERLVILDPCLDGGRGHYLALARALTLGAQALGAEVVWACHSGFSGEGALPGVILRRCFPRSFFDVAPSEMPMTDLGPDFAPVLGALMAEFAGAGTHVLAHSCDPGLLRAALSVAEAHTQLPASLHLCLPNHPWRMPGRAAGTEASRALALLTETPAWNNSLFLWTETRTLAAGIGQRLGCTLPVLNLPAPAWAEAHPLPPTGLSPQGPLRLAFLGEARPDKGFLDLPACAEALSTQPGIELLVHAVPPSHGFTQAHEAALARLARTRGVRLLHGPLDEADYRACLAEVDGLLLPYLPQAYAGRGSGIVCDAIAAGRIVVARAGPTMGELSEEGVVLLFDALPDLARVAARLVQEREALSRRALAEAHPFRARRQAQIALMGLVQRRAAVGAARASGAGAAPRPVERERPRTREPAF